MKPLFIKASHRSAAATLLGVGCLFLTSCQEPAGKPIPPLDPSKRITEPEQTTPAADAPVKTGQLTRMQLGNLYQLVQKDAVLLYDVRPLIYYKMGHIPGAVNWPKKDLDRYYDKQAPNLRAANANNTPVVVYCTDFSCPDGLAVARELVARGHTVSILQGGYEAWKIAAE
ncbi:MAG: rhodanese-like domain-containing protein [Verrucomicrobia bacterium]|jgi:rhodanese-related sulfurtransferase|nr:rhodanese-like domain-containing protein [Verrucomicrobiota bacterium]|tara:strand:+ start:4191 stop:4703 length:513 start_codon:yes stop_codon:yes gene_type:complete